MTMIDKLLEIIQKEVGVREEGGNNKGRRIREYQSATDLSPEPWAWCAAFVDWSVLQWTKIQGFDKWLGLQVMSVDEWRPTTAAAYGFLRWSKDRPMTTLRLAGNSVAMPGDIVVFNFSHVGFVVERSTSGDLITVEGNTNGKGDRESTTGDGVWVKQRSRKLVRSFIRVRPRTS